MLDPYIQAVVSALYEHPYLILFFGVAFLGEILLLPAIYLALKGALDLPYVIGISIVSIVLSDIAWFYVGRHMTSGIFRRFVSDRVMATIDRLSGPFDAHKAKVLFVSKFVYGTRTAVQLLSGARGMPFRTYFSVNFLGVSSFMAGLVALAASLDLTLGGLEASVQRIEVVFLIFVALVVGGHLTIGRIVKRSWSSDGR